MTVGIQGARGLPGAIGPRGPVGLMSTSNQNGTSGDFLVDGTITCDKLIVKQMVLPAHGDKEAVRMVGSYPWEYVDANNFKTWRFCIMNYSTTTFDKTKLAAISKAVEDYINNVVFTSWGLKVDIVIHNVEPSYFTDILGASGFAGVHGNPRSTYISIFLMPAFNTTNVANNFGASVYGCNSLDIDTGRTANFYISAAPFPSIGNLMPGFPYIVIASGSIATGNGIIPKLAANISSGTGPQTYDDILAFTLASNMLSVLNNPSNAMFIMDGDNIGSYLGATDIGFKTNLFWKRDIVEPFADGEMVPYGGYSFPNFAYPAYFCPLNDSGIYDYLGKTDSPFIPYCGKQWGRYQVNTGGDGIHGGNIDVSQMKLVYLTHNVNTPAGHVLLNDCGSMYNYSSWGFSCKLTSGVAKLKAGNSVVAPIVSDHTYLQYTKKSFNKSLPQLSKCFFIDPEDNILTMRYKIVNLVPSVIDIHEVSKHVKPMEKYLRDLYAIEWNVKVVFNCITINSESDQWVGGVIGGTSIYDGTECIHFITPVNCYDFNKMGAVAAYAGAFNTNNSYNTITGPLINSYMNQNGFDNEYGNHISIPPLPLGTPYIMQPSSNMGGNTTIIADTSGYSWPVLQRLGNQQSLPLNYYPIHAKVVQIYPSLALLNKLTVGNPSYDEALVSTIVGKIVLIYYASASSAFSDYYTYWTRTVQACEKVGAIFSVRVNMDVSTGTATSFGGVESFRIQGAGFSTYVLAQSFKNYVNANPDAYYTIAQPTPNAFIVPTLFVTITHEAKEQSMDIQYGTFICNMVFPTKKTSGANILTDISGNVLFNTDGGFLFNQYQNGDNVTGQLTYFDASQNLYSRFEGYPSPAYYVPNLKFDHYDNTNTNFKPLMTVNRQQGGFQLQAPLFVMGSDNSPPYTIGISAQPTAYLLLGWSSGSLSEFDSLNCGGCFEYNTFFPTVSNPGGTLSYILGPPNYWADVFRFSLLGFSSDSPCIITPVTRIYNEVLSLENIIMVENTNGKKYRPLIESFNSTLYNTQATNVSAVQLIMAAIVVYNTANTTTKIVSMKAFTAWRVGKNTSDVIGLITTAISTDPGLLAFCF